MNSPFDFIDTNLEMIKKLTKRLSSHGRFLLYPYLETLFSCMKYRVRSKPVGTNEQTLPPILNDQRIMNNRIWMHPRHVRSV
jgi:hypothetical protein